MLFQSFRNMLHLQTPTTPQSYGNQYKPQHEQHKQHKQHVAFTTPTKTFRYPNTPTSTVATARTAYSIEDRLDDRMNANIYNSAPIAMNSRDDVNVNDIDYTIKPTASSNSSLEEASVASSSSTAQNFNVENGVAFAKSQAALNKDYKNRRMAIKKLPLSARATTGINLKNLHPLAVRNGELC